MNVSAKKDNEDDTFIWQDYLDMTNTVEVPHILFSHVEQSLETGLQEGMMLEVPHKTSSELYWIATITMACGPLLRLRYIGQEENRSNDFWCDLTKVKVHPLGWCKSQGLKFVPPIELKDKLIDHAALIDKAIECGKSIPLELLTDEGFTPVERIRQGMKLEVQDKMDPNHLWFATIIENVGGRLLLRHDSPDSSCPDFWLFYNSPRLFRIGWTEKQGLPYVLKWPSNIKTHHSFNEWEAVKEMAKEDARRIPLPPDLFQNCLPSTFHQFKVGMKLEAIHPHNMVEICPASIIKICNSHYFLVKIDSHNSSESDEIESFWLCSAEHPYIFPVGWAQNQGLQLTHPRGWTTTQEEFDWQEYLESTNSYPAPITCFPQRSSAAELGFEVGMKLEAVNPENRHQICAASIDRIIDNLLWIRLDSHDSFHPCHIVSMDSVDIFPVGWCESNSYPLKTPQFYQQHIKTQEMKEITPKKNNNSSPPTTQQKSFWCPKIYFNHKCFSGPFLSKGKLAQLPKAVGPGPVTLVMREVLAMLISVAYKSSRVLKELQTDGKPEPGMHLEVLKAKYKTNTYRASVAVVTSADEVPTFCKAVCSRLQVCPYMFGPISVGENNCPENCNTLSKTRFTQYWVQGKRKLGRPKGDSNNMLPRPKKRRGRRKAILTEKPQNEDICDDSPTKPEVADIPVKNLENDMDITDTELSTKVENTEPTPKFQAQANGVKRRYKKKEFPKTAMKTRGAKLPNFALQIRASHWPHKKLSVPANESSTLDRSQDASLSSAESCESRKSNNESPVQNCEDQIPPDQNCADEIIPDQNCEDSQEAKSEPMEISEENSIPAEHSCPKLLPSDFVELESNPLYWSEDDVYHYLKKTDDCAWLASKVRDELIDGLAFMMLNLPTLKEHLFLKTTPALKLCSHIQRIKLAYYLQYFADSEP